MTYINSTTWLIHGLFQPEVDVDASAAVIDSDRLGERVDDTAPDSPIENFNLSQKTLRLFMTLIPGFD